MNRPLTTGLFRAGKKGETLHGARNVAIIKVHRQTPITPLIPSKRNYQSLNRAVYSTDPDQDGGVGRCTLEGS